MSYQATASSLLARRTRRMFTVGGRVLAAGATLWLAGCTLGPTYKRPPVTTPDQFYLQPAATPPAAGAAASPGAPATPTTPQTPAEAASLADAPWWQVFQDPALKTLIDEALRNGFDVRVATARVEEARARFGIAGSALYPQVNYSGSYQRERFSEFQAGAPTTGGSFNVITANLGLSWEIDLWGRVRRLTEAAKAQYLASEEGRRAVMLTLASEVASAYFDLRQLDEDLVIAQHTTSAFQDTYDLFNRQFQGGVASGLDVADAEAALANEAAQIPVLESQIAAKENQLTLLIGRNPGPVQRGTSLFEQLLPPQVPPGLPAALLMRRPDLRQSEQLLVAANANIGAAQAAFFPALSLTGAFGGLSPDLKDLFSKGQTWSVGPSLMGPIFQGGALRAAYDLAVAQYEEAKVQYEQQVTNAFGEVSTSLVALDKLAEAEKRRQRAVNAYQEAVRLSRLRYTSGLSAYFEVVDALENLLGSENGLAQVRHDRLVSLVNFYKALGGGWQLGDDARSADGASAATAAGTISGTPAGTASMGSMAPTAQTAPAGSAPPAASTTSAPPPSTPGAPPARR